MLCLLELLFEFRELPFVSPSLSVEVSTPELLEVRKSYSLSELENCSVVVPLLSCDVIPDVRSLQDRTIVSLFDLVLRSTLVLRESLS